MNNRIRTSLIIAPLLLFSLISEIFLSLFLFSLCVIIIFETNLNSKKNIRVLIYLILISIYFFLLILNFDFLIYAIYLSLLSFAISIFFNILELKKNKENLNFSNQILLENKKVFNLFFLRETSTIYYLFGTLSFYYLYQSPSEINWVLLPLSTVFAIDTSSYFIGSKFGKRKISFL